MVALNSNHHGGLSACIYIDYESLYKDGPCPSSNLKTHHGRLPWKAKSFKHQILNILALHMSNSRARTCTAGFRTSTGASSRLMVRSALQ